MGVETNIPTLVAGGLAFCGVLLTSWWWLLRRFVEDLGRKDEEIAKQLANLTREVNERHAKIEARLNAHIEVLPQRYVLRSEIERRMQEQTEVIRSLREWLDRQNDEVGNFYRQYAAVLQWAQRQMERD
jgi:predicted RNase H-like nuclease (RuvC/YqgF family)